MKLGVALVALACATLLPSRLALAEETRVTALPPVVRDVDIDEQLGARLDLSLELTDSSGRRVRLGDYFVDGRPAILSLAYFRCPMLCGLVLAGLARGLAELPFRAGDDYRLITVSFDPKDTAEDAARKQATVVGALGRSASPSAWPFLVGDRDSTHALADRLGFRFAYDARTDQYAHPAAVFVLTPDGRISRYLYGTDFSPRDLRLALVEASAGKVGTIVDRVLLTCYRFDPATRRFGPYIRGFMRIGAAFILVAVGTMLVVLFRAERRRRFAGEGVR